LVAPTWLVYTHVRLDSTSVSWRSPEGLGPRAQEKPCLFNIAQDPLEAANQVWSHYGRIVALYHRAPALQPRFTKDRGGRYRYF
jgi:hypothetical protein